MLVPQPRVPQPPEVFRQFASGSFTTAERRSERAFNEVVREYLKSSLEHDLLMRQSRAGKAPLSNWDKWANSSYAAEEELARAKDEFAGRVSADRHEQMIDWLMQQHQLRDDQRQELFFAILQARVELCETIRHRTLGDFSTTSAEPIRLQEEANGHAVPSVTQEGPLDAPRVANLRATRFQAAASPEENRPTGPL